VALAWTPCVEPPESTAPRPLLYLVGSLPDPQPGTGAPAGTDVSERRRLRSRRRVRRNRLVATLVVGVVTLLLALPVSALGGRPAAAGPQAVPGAPIGGFVYVVQPGDTLWSIARQFDQGGDPGQLAAALAGRLGSQVVVPGERIRVP